MKDFNEMMLNIFLDMIDKGIEDGEPVEFKRKGESNEWLDMVCDRFFSKHGYKVKWAVKSVNRITFTKHE